MSLPILQNLALIFSLIRAVIVKFYSVVVWVYVQISKLLAWISVQLAFAWQGNRKRLQKAKEILQTQHIATEENAVSSSEGPQNGGNGSSETHHHTVSIKRPEGSLGLILHLKKSTGFLTVTNIQETVPLDVKSALQVGDQLVKMNGTRFSSSKAFLAALKVIPAGEDIVFELLRKQAQDGSMDHDDSESKVEGGTSTVTPDSAEAHNPLEDRGGASQQSDLNMTFLNPESPETNSLPVDGGGASQQSDLNMTFLNPESPETNSLPVVGLRKNEKEIPNALDKEVFETQDTVTCVAVSDRYIAWGSQGYEHQVPCLKVEKVVIKKDDDSIGLQLEFKETKNHASQIVKIKDTAHINVKRCLRVGDIVMSLNGQTYATPELRDAVSKVAAREEVEFEVQRLEKAPYGVFIYMKNDNDKQYTWRKFIPTGQMVQALHFDSPRRTQEKFPKEAKVTNVHNDEERNDKSDESSSLLTTVHFLMKSVNSVFCSSKEVEHSAELCSPVRPDHKENSQVKESKDSVLVCGCSNGEIFGVHLNENGDVEFKGSVKPENFEGNLTSLHQLRTTPDTDKPLLAIGSDSNAVFFYKSSIKQAEKIDKNSITPYKHDCIKTKGKVLGVKFLNSMKHVQSQKDFLFEIVIADTIELAVYTAYKDGDHKIYRTFVNTRYDLSVEAGCMLSCSDDGKFIAVGCGDKTARILERLRYNEKYYSELDNSCRNCRTHDSWGEAMKFTTGLMILGVDISADGERLAVATDANEAEVFDAKMGFKLRRYKRSGRVRSVCFDSTGQHLLVGGFDKQVSYYNVNSGFKPTYSIKEPPTSKKIQSVSLDSEGKTLAIGIWRGQARVYDVCSLKLKFEAEFKKAVYVVKLSPDGKYLAVGDYASKVYVYKIESETDPNLEKKPIYDFDCSDEALDAHAYIWGLDFKKLKNGDNKYRLAVGSWNHFAYVIDFDMMNSNSPGNIRRIQFKNRVFDVSLTENGEMLAVAVRDGTAAVFDMDGHSEEPVFETKDGDRVYCIAVSPGATYLAFGGISKKVSLFKDELLDANQLTARDQKRRYGQLQIFEHQHTVQRMQFMDEETFAALSEDGKCVLYDVNACIPLLQMSYDEKGNSLAMNAKMLAVACGLTVTVYGQLENGYGPKDRPSLSLAVDFILQDQKSLEIAMNSHDTLVNVTDENNDTLLHKAVEETNKIAVSTILNGSCPCGLIRNRKGETAFSQALKNKSLVDQLLRAITNKSIANSPDLYSTFFEQPKRDDGQSGNDQSMTTFELLGRKFPDLFLRFLSEMELDVCESDLLGNISDIPLQEPLYVGLEHKTPKGFWESYYNKNKDDGEFDHSSPRYAVQAFRVPIPGFCGSNNEDSKNAQMKVPLQVIVEAAQVVQDCSVFDEGTVVHDLVAYKWKTLHNVFILHSLYFIIYLGCCCYSALDLPTLGCVSFFSLDGLYMLSRSLFLGFFTLHYLAYELIQVKYQYEAFSYQPDTDTVSEHTRTTDSAGFNAYRWYRALKSHMSDSWNIIDAAAFGTQLVANILIFFRHPSYPGFASVSIVLLFGKLLFFARAIPSFGPFVKMIQDVIGGMLYFLGVLLVFLLGFAFGFKVLLGGKDIDEFESLTHSLFTVTLMMYGEFPGDLTKFNSDLWVASILFEGLLLLILVIMFNLLVAIMTDSYEKARDTSKAELNYEIAKIILELEMYYKCSGDGMCNESLLKLFKAALFPKWIHMLKPVEGRHATEKGDENQRMKLNVLESIQNQDAKLAEIMKKLVSLDLQGLERAQHDISKRLSQIEGRMGGIGLEDKMEH